MHSKLNESENSTKSYQNRSLLLILHQQQHDAVYAVEKQWNADAIRAPLPERLPQIHNPIVGRKSSTRTIVKN
jgi:hypothetical protein